MIPRLIVAPCKFGFVLQITWRGNGWRDVGPQKVFVRGRKGGRIKLGLFVPSVSASASLGSSSSIIAKQPRLQLRRNRYPSKGDQTSWWKNCILKETSQPPKVHVP